MYADGLAMKFRGHVSVGRVDAKKADYFEGLSPFERLALCARVTFKIAQYSLRQRVGSTA